MFRKQLSQDALYPLFFSSKLIKAAERETRRPKTASWIRLPANRGFMDDLIISTESHIQAHWVQQALEDTVSWARMKFKPNKCQMLGH